MTGTTGTSGTSGTSGTKLADAFQSPETKRRYVRRLFATIADRYDLITRILSFGRDRHWKAKLIDLAGLQPGHRVLDLACGTGDIALAAARRGANVVGLDITPRMLVLAKQKPISSDGTAAWMVGDMGALPISTNAIDVVTTGYGLRNVPDLQRALAEIHRVLKIGGVALSLDFDRPETSWIRLIYLSFLTTFGSALGFVLHRDPDTYRYIPASIRRYPGARGVAAMMRESGFTEVQHLRVLGGLMAIHVARK